MVASGDVASEEVETADVVREASVAKRGGLHHVKTPSIYRL